MDHSGSGVSESGSMYWVAAFAFDQNNGNAPFGGEAQRVLNRAMGSSFGTVVCVDREGFAFKRVCFLYEAYAAIGHSQSSEHVPHRVDLYTAIPHVTRKHEQGHALGFADGFTMSDFSRGRLDDRRDVELNKSLREANFPITLIEDGLKLKIAQLNSAIPSKRYPPSKAGTKSRSQDQVLKLKISS